MSAGIFAFRQEIKAFDESFVKLIGRETEAITRQHLSDRNTQRLNHGRTWKTYAEGAGDPGSMQTHSMEMMTHLDDVVLCDDRLIRKMIDQVSQSFHRQFMHMMYRTVSEACDKSGNVVSQRDHGDFPQTFLEMLRSIEFGVDYDGKVSRPEMHLDPETFKKIVPLLESQPESYKAEVAALTETKTKDALAREAARLARFKCPP